MRRPHSKLAELAAVLVLLVGLAPTLAACGGSPAAGGGDTSASQTSGPSYEAPSQLSSSEMDASTATQANGSAIDTSHTSDGYVCAAATSDTRLKLLVTCNEQSYNYDLPGDGGVLTAPINMGNGTYTFAVMRNTSGSNYVEINSVTTDVTLSSEFAPFLHPNVYCNYDENSKCVALARELAADAENEGDVVHAVFDYITQNISYDFDKAQRLENATGYVPDPDQTLESGKGICFDYASLGAAMLRSLGIPTQIKTGYVAPDDIYHAWLMVYIDGSWQCATINVPPDEWTRLDLTFAAAGDEMDYVGDGTSYTERYTY